MIRHNLSVSSHFREGVFYSILIESHILFVTRAKPMIGNEMLKGDLVRLAPLSKDDLPTLHRWFTSPKYTRLSSSRPGYPHPFERTEKWYKEGKDDPHTIPLTIRLVETNTLVGHCVFRNISYPFRHAAIGLGIGDPDMRGKGYGGETIRLMLRFGFMELNLYRIELETNSYNAAALRLYRKLGFVEEVVQREAVYRDNIYYDIIVMSILYPEWKERYDAGR